MGVPHLHRGSTFARGFIICMGGYHLTWEFAICMGTQCHVYQGHCAQMQRRTVVQMECFRVPWQKQQKYR